MSITSCRQGCFSLPPGACPAGVAFFSCISPRFVRINRKNEGLRNRLRYKRQQMVRKLGQALQTLTPEQRVAFLRETASQNRRQAMGKDAYLRAEQKVKQEQGPAQEISPEKKIEYWKDSPVNNL